MNRYFVVLATIVVAVNARAGRQGWSVPSGGWPAPTAAPTTLPPPTGWPAPAPAPGWSAPAPNNVVASADGELAAAGSGWAASSQNDELLAVDLTADTTGSVLTNVSQEGVIAQSTAITPTDALAVQAIDVTLIATAPQSLDTTLVGGDLAAASFSGWSGAAGEAQSSAAGAVDVLVNKP